MTENSSLIFVAALCPGSGQSTVNKTILSALLFAECPVHVRDTSPRDNKPGFTYFIRHLVPALPAAWRILAAWEGVASVYLSADSCFENEADVATIDQKQRSSFFRIADVLVFPMPYLPVIVRAAAFGQPVISFDRGCIIDNMDPRPITWCREMLILCLATPHRSWRYGLQTVPIGQRKRGGSTCDRSTSRPYRIARWQWG
jgi:hypothetical protein